MNSARKGGSGSSEATYFPPLKVSEHRSRQKSMSSNVRRAASGSSTSSEASHLPPEVSEHRRRQEEKDREFQALLKQIELDSASRNHSVKETTAALASGAESASAARLSRLKAERAREEALPARDAQALLGRKDGRFGEMRCCSW